MYLKVSPSMSEDQDQEVIPEHVTIVEEADDIDISITGDDAANLQNLLQPFNKGKKSKQLQIISLDGAELPGISNGITTLSSALTSGLTSENKIWHGMLGLPRSGSSEITHIITVKSNELDDEHDSNSISDDHGNQHNAQTLAAMLMSPPSHDLPPDTPTWGLRIKDCEAIGDSFRGWVQSEVELDLLLTYHKQQTQSFWGTRQSPSPARASTRLMWKSQYVPFDGIPFINSGSRAIVMECQYGPRRKGNSPARKQSDQALKMEFRQTCPARIYIKKARKFPDYKVDLSLDKKNLRISMDRAFQELKVKDLTLIGEERFYVQLPTQKAHEFHYDHNGVDISAAPILPEPSQRLHARVLDKIRELVAQGESRVYAVRKQLRKFVERDLFESPDMIPERHNLSYFPTVHDLQNHIHQALQELESGGISIQGQVLEMTSDGEVSSDQATSNQDDAIIWQAQPHPETVTVTLTQHPEQGEGHVISRIETHLSDGTTQITQLTPETAQLLSKLHPSMFPQGSFIQLQDAQQTSVVMEAHITGDNMEATVPVVFSQAEAQSDEIEIIKAERQVEGIDDMPMIAVAMAPECDELIQTDSRELPNEEQ